MYLCLAVAFQHGDTRKAGDDLIMVRRVPDVEGRGRPQAVLAWESPRLRGSSTNAHGRGPGRLRGR